MKRIISLILALAALLCLTACGGGDAGETTPAAAEGYKFTYNGTEIAMKADAAPILAKLGEPKSYTEETSCAFTGLDKTYYFGGFYMTTYPDGDKDYVYSVWFADDSVTTQEGVYIGATQAEVEKAYGADSFNGSNAYVLTKGESTLSIMLTDGTVSGIRYDAIIE